MPTAAERADYYAECAFYHPSAYAVRASARKVLFEERLRQIKQFCRVQSGRMLLDLGCAAGHFLAAAQAEGWHGVGVELSEPLAEHARSAYGLQVFQTIDEVECRQFAVVHANHVLEHLTDPLFAMRVAFQVLVPDGLLVVEVPNQFGSWSGRLKGLWVSLTGNRPRTWPWEPASDRLHHVYFFSPQSLFAVLKRAGFVIESVSTVNHGYYRGTDSLACARRRVMHAIDTAAALVTMGPVIVVFARKASHITGSDYSGQ